MFKIEKAFKKFDLNGDGYLSWEEFSKVGILHDLIIMPTLPQIGLDPAQARRIFLSCSQSRHGKMRKPANHVCVNFFKSV